MEVRASVCLFVAGQHPDRTTGASESNSTAVPHSPVASAAPLTPVRVEHRRNLPSGKRGWLHHRGTRAHSGSNLLVL
jgi:hypothetical protein